jgi:hypothetical protein
MTGEKIMPGEDDDLNNEIGEVFDLIEALKKKGYKKSREITVHDPSAADGSAEKGKVKLGEIKEFVRGVKRVDEIYKMSEEKRRSLSKIPPPISEKDRRFLSLFKKALVLEAFPPPPVIAPSTTAKVSFTNSHDVSPPPRPPRPRLPLGSTPAGGPPILSSSSLAQGRGVPLSRMGSSRQQENEDSSKTFEVFEKIKDAIRKKYSPMDFRVMNGETIDGVTKKERMELLKKINSLEERASERGEIDLNNFRILTEWCVKMKIISQTDISDIISDAANHPKPRRK